MPSFRRLFLLSCVASSVWAFFACSPPVLMETESGWQPQASKHYTISYLKDQHTTEAMPEGWTLMKPRAFHTSLKKLTPAETYDFSYALDASGELFEVGVLYAWTHVVPIDQLDQPVQEFVRQYRDHLSGIPLTDLLLSRKAKQVECPCELAEIVSGAIETQATIGYELIARQRRKESTSGPMVGVYLAVVRKPAADRAKDKESDRRQVVVLYLRRMERFEERLRDVKSLVRRIQFQ